MQNAAFGELGLNCCYLAFDVHPDHLAEALSGAKRMQFLGLNLTLPHKLMAMGMMDELDQSARRWGAVNTVCFEGRTPAGAWEPLRQFMDAPPVELRSTGHNTDAEGFATSLREDFGFHLEEARVMVLGTGGAGRVAALRLAQEGLADLFLVNRTADKAEALAAEVRERFPDVHVLTGYPHREVDLVVNATSLGLRPEDPLPIDLDRFPLTDTKAAYDMVYRPAETPFLAMARDSGAQTANGLGMLLRQGALAFELWTGVQAPLPVMRAALEKEIYES